MEDRKEFRHSSHKFSLRAGLFALAVLGGLFAQPAKAANPQFAPIPQLYFTKVFGGANPLPQVLNVVNVGAAFQFGVTSSSTGGSWLAVQNGCCGTTPGIVTVGINAAVTMAVGSYPGQVVITATSGNVVLTVPVTLTVVAAGSTYFDNMAGALSFFMQTGGKKESPLICSNTLAPTVTATGIVTLPFWLGQTRFIRSTR